MTIHIGTGNIYFDNYNTNESIYGFIFIHQDTDQKFLQTKFSFARNLNQYTCEFVGEIKAQDKIL